MKKSIKAKLLSAFLLIGILSIVTTGLLFFFNAKSTLQEVYFNHLTSIRETKKRQIESYLDLIRNQVITFSQNQMIIDSMKEFKTAFSGIKSEFADADISRYALSVREYYDDEYLSILNRKVSDKRESVRYLPQDDEAVILQYHYIVNNQNPAGAKDKLVMATDGSRYSRIHEKYHPIIRDYKQRFGYYDIFLIDAQSGRIIYSVDKEVDFTTSLLTGPYKDTNLARVFVEARNAPDNAFSRMVDYELYDPSYADPASFIASPVFDGDKKIGVLVLQIPINKINEVMTGNHNWKGEGLGESGETYIAGSDYKMRSDSRFIIEEPDRYFDLLEESGTDEEIIKMIKLHFTSVLFQEIRTEAIEAALRGNTDTRIIKDYRGISVLSSYTPLSIEDVNWVMLSEIDKAEAFASLYVAGNRIYLIAICILMIVTIIAFSIADDILRPVFELVETAKTISRGDFSKRVGITQQDEIGQLADTFNMMTDSLVEANARRQNAIDDLAHSNRDLLQAKEKLEIEIAERDKAEKKIHKLSRAVEQSPTIVIITDSDGNIEFVNSKFTQITGFTYEEAIGKNPLVFKSVEKTQGAYKRLWKTITSGEEWIGELNNKKKNGETYWVSASISSVKDKDGYITHFVAIEEDITVRKRLEQLQKNTMKEREQTIKRLENLMNFSVFMREENQEIELIRHMAYTLKRDFNPDIIAVLMYNRERNMLDVTVIKPDIPVDTVIKSETLTNPELCSVLRTGQEAIVRDIRKDAPCECLSYKIKEGGYACYPMITGGIIAGMALLIKEEEGYWNSGEKHSLFSTYVGLVASALQNVRLMDMTRHAAVTDGLTGVYNRRFFDEMLDKQIRLAKRRKKSLSLLILDIDHFKAFNDTYGHIAGDRVLKQLTNNLKDSIRDSDILARYGGEEFVIIMPEADLHNTLDKAEKIRRNVEALILDDIVSGQSLKMTISIGVAAFPVYGTEFSTLVGSADKALYKAKERGRNRVEAL